MRTVIARPEAVQAFLPGLPDGIGGFEAREFAGLGVICREMTKILVTQNPDDFGTLDQLVGAIAIELPPFPTVVLEARPEAVQAFTGTKTPARITGRVLLSVLIIMH